MDDTEIITTGIVVAQHNAEDDHDDHDGGDDLKEMQVGIEVNEEVTDDNVIRKSSIAKIDDTVASLNRKLNIESGLCPQGHKLRSSEVNVSRVEPTICDYCSSFIDVGNKFYACYRKDSNCNFELCTNCYYDIEFQGNEINYKKISDWFDKLPKAKKQLQWRKLIYPIYLERKPVKTAALSLFSMEDEEEEEEEKKQAKKLRKRKRAESISSMGSDRDDILDKLYVSGKGEILTFLASFIGDYVEQKQLQQTRKQKIKFEMKGLINYLSNDGKSLWNQLARKKWKFDLELFSSDKFILLLNELHYVRSNIESVVLSVFGQEMQRYDGINPPKSFEYERFCRLCKRDCDMDTWYSPQHIYWCPMSRSLVCPVHAFGAPAQSKLFFHEISQSFIDLLQCYRLLKNESKSSLISIFDEATQTDNGQNSNDTQNSNVFITTPNQLCQLAVGIIKRALEMNDGNFDQEKLENEVSFKNVNKHMMQCGGWILGDARKRVEFALNRELFVKSDVFTKMILSYYWEFNERLTAEEVNTEIEFNVWKYIKHWLERMDLTPQRLQQQLLMGNDINIWRLYCFLVGIQEPQSSILDARYQINHSQDAQIDEQVEEKHKQQAEEEEQAQEKQQHEDMPFVQLLKEAALHERLEKDFLQTRKEQLPGGLRKFDRLMVYWQHLDVMLAKEKRETFIDINWIKIAQFLRCSSVDYRRLLLHEWLPSVNETIEYHNKVQSSLNRSILRCIIWHFIQTFYYSNWYECPWPIIDAMLMVNNNVEQLLDYLCRFDSKQEKTGEKTQNTSKQEKSEKSEKSGGEIKGDTQLSDSLSIIRKLDCKDKYGETLARGLQTRPTVRKILKRAEKESELVDYDHLTFWEFVYTNRLSDMMVDYFYLRCGHIRQCLRRRMFDARNIPKNVFGREVFLLWFDGCDEEEMEYHWRLEIPQRLNHIEIKWSKHNEYNAKEFSKDVNFDNLQFQYRLMRRHCDIESSRWSLVSQSRHEEGVILRFRISSTETPVIIRLGNRVHNNTSELTIIPSTVEGANTRRSYITKLMYGGESHVEKEIIIPEVNFELDNHVGQWFTLYLRENMKRNSGFIYLFGEWISNIHEAERNIRAIRRAGRSSTKRLRIVRETNLVFEKHTSSNLLYWIGFAGYGHDFTLSTPDLDLTVMESWIKWSDFLHIMPIAESKALDDDDYFDDYFDGGVDLKTVSIEMIGNEQKKEDEVKGDPDSDSSDSSSEDVCVDLDEEIEDEIIWTTGKVVEKAIRSKFDLVVDCCNTFVIDKLGMNGDWQRISSAILDTFKQVKPVLSRTPSLSTMSVYGLEFKSDFLIPTAVVNEQLSTNGECVQALGNTFCCIEQVTYDTIRIDKEVWLFCQEFYQTLINGDSDKQDSDDNSDIIDESKNSKDDKDNSDSMHATKVGKYSDDSNSKDNKGAFDRLLLCAFGTSASEANDENIVGSTDGGFDMINIPGDKIGVNNRDSVGITLYVNKMYEFEEKSKVLFSFNEIRQMNEEMYFRLAILIGQESITSRKSRMERISKALRNNPIWPHISCNLSRDGTIVENETNRLNYMWRGGSTLISSSQPLPMLRSTSKSHKYRTIYYEVGIERVGLNKSICIGAGLGAVFNYLASTVPGRRIETWGLDGSNGRLFDENTRDFVYGPTFSDNLIIGCGFIIEEQEATKEEEEEAKREEYFNSKLFFTYNGYGMKLYPHTQTKSILPGDILHRINALCSIGSEDCLFTVNFGPRFKYSVADTDVDRLLFETDTITNKNNDEENNDDNNDDNNDNNDNNNNNNNIDKNTSAAVLNVNVPDVSHVDWHRKLLEEAEEEKIRDIIFEIGASIEARALGTSGTSVKLSKDKGRYRLIYDKAMLSYYFYLKPIENLNETHLYQLLVELDLLGLATLLNGSGVNGAQFSDLRRFIENESFRLRENSEKNSTAIDVGKERLIQIWENGEPKHKSLLLHFVNTLISISEELYQKNISPSTKFGIGNKNIPPALWDMVNDDCHSNELVQENLVRLWRLVSHHRRHNFSKNSDKLSVTKQEIFLDFIAFHLNSNHSFSLISQLIVTWSRGEYDDDGDSNRSGFTAKDELYTLVNGLLSASNNPLSTALQMAAFLKNISSLFGEIDEETQDLSLLCEHSAVNILEQITSNRLAIILLESNDALQIALDNELNVFIASKRVTLLRQAIWTRSSNLLLPSVDIDNGDVEADTNGDGSGGGSELSTWIGSIVGNYWNVLKIRNGFSFNFDFVFGIKYQLNWFVSPIAKQQIEIFVYLLYCALLYLVIIEGNYNAYESNISLYEFLWWICNASFIFHELRNCVYIGLAKYKNDRENWIDIFVGICYTLLFVMRFLGIYQERFGIFDIFECNSSDNDDDTDSPYDCALNTYFVTCYILLIIGIACRLSYMLLVFYDMGFLVKALMTMGNDIINFLVFVVIWVSGFTLCMYMGTVQQVEGYASFGDTYRTLFYAVLGDFDWGAFDSDNDGVNLNSTRLLIVEIVFIIWLTLGLIVFINFVIAVMSTTYQTVSEDVNKYISMHRMKVLRVKDEYPAAIPAPFQSILSIFEIIWFTIFEPVVWLFTGKIVNIEYALCRFDHWNEYDLSPNCSDKNNKHSLYKYESAKPVKISWLMTPHFIKYSDQIEGREALKGGTFWQRIKTLPTAWKEMRTGMLITSKRKTRKLKQTFFGDKNEGLTDPFIWTCVYCCKINSDFDKNYRRKHFYSDIIRYCRYNDTLPPKFGFADNDIQFLQHIKPQLCDNCFRAKNWSQRHLFIDTLISFYLYIIISFICIRLPLFIFVSALSIILSIIVRSLQLVIFLVKFLIWLLLQISLRPKICCAQIIVWCKNCTQFNQSNIDDYLLDEIEMADEGAPGLFSSGGAIGGGAIGALAGDSDETSKTDRESKYRLERKTMRKRLFIDYSNMYVNLDYQLILIVANTRLTSRESESLKNLLIETMDITGLKSQHDTNNIRVKSLLNIDSFVKQLAHRRDLIYNIDYLVDDHIVLELNSRIVLLRAKYKACSKFKQCLDKLIYMYDDDQDSYASGLPKFSLKLVAARDSVESKWGVYDKSNYFSKIRKQASKQTRLKYQLSINDSNENNLTF